MTVTEAMELTIETAIERGIIDPKLHAGPIEAIRQLCADADRRSTTSPTRPCSSTSALSTS